MNSLAGHCLCGRRERGRSWLFIRSGEHLKAESDGELRRGSVYVIWGETENVLVNTWKVPEKNVAVICGGGPNEVR